MVRVTGSHLIGKALKLEGISNTFTLAGDHILPVLDVMSDMDFRFIDTRQEKVVQGLGGYGEFVEKPSELRPALQRALDSGRPALVNVAVQRATSPRAGAAIARRKAAAGKAL